MGAVYLRSPDTAARVTCPMLVFGAPAGPASPMTPRARYACVVMAPRGLSLKRKTSVWPAMAVLVWRSESGALNFSDGGMV